MVLPPVKGHVHRCKTLEDRREGERNGGQRTVEKESEWWPEDRGADHADVGDSGSCGDANGDDEDDDRGGVSKDCMKQHGSIACRKAVGSAFGVMIL